MGQTAKLPGYVTVSWSHDGKQISFTQKSAEGETNIYIMKSEGSDVVKLNTDLKSTMYASWSPDGKKIVFSSTASKDVTDIWVMNVDGTNLTQLTKDSRQNWAAYFSPNGKKIVFNSTRVNGNPAIFMMNSDGSNQQKITQDETNSYFSPIWSRDGKQIVYYTYINRKSQIMVMNANGSNPQEVGEGTEPFWSHTDKHVFFGTKLSGKESKFGQISVQGSESKQLCDVSGYLGRLSPDGKQVVFIAVNSSENAKSRNLISVLNLSNCQVKILKE